MPFVDGEPIDASKLGALETELNILKASMPKIGSSSTSININSSSPSVTTVSPSGTVTPSITPSNVFGGISADVPLTPGSRSTFTIDYSAAGLSSNPKAIILTPRGSEKVFSINQALVKSNTVTSTSAQCHVYHRPDATACTVKYYFMVIS